MLCVSGLWLGISVAYDYERCYVYHIPAENDKLGRTIGGGEFKEMT